MTRWEVTELIEKILSESAIKIPYTEQGAAWLTSALAAEGITDIKVSIVTCSDHTPPKMESRCDACEGRLARKLVVDFPPIQYAQCPFCLQRYPDTDGHECTEKAKDWITPKTE